MIVPQDGYVEDFSPCTAQNCQIVHEITTPRQKGTKRIYLDIFARENEGRLAIIVPGYAKQAAKDLF